MTGFGECFGVIRGEGIPLEGRESQNCAICIWTRPYYGMWDQPFNTVNYW